MVDDQVISYIVRLESTHSSRRMNSYFVVLTLIHCVTSAVVFFATSVLEKTVSMILAVIVYATFVSVCNKVAMLHALWSFNSIYRIIQMLLGGLGLNIINDYYCSEYTSNDQIQSCHIAGVCMTLRGRPKMTSFFRGEGVFLKISKLETTSFLDDP